MSNNCPRCQTRSVTRQVTTPDGQTVEIEGALSRADNKTYICSACGLDEAMLDYDGTGNQPVSEWPVVPKYHEMYDAINEPAIWKGETDDDG